MIFSVAHASGSASFWQEIEIEASLTAEQAIHHSKLLSEFPTLDLDILKVGIFGKVCSLSQIIQEGDRVEVYLPALVKDDDDDSDD